MIRLFLILSIGSLTAFPASGQDIPPVQRGENGVPDADWPASDFPALDNAAQSRDLLPLRTIEVPEGALEVRVWIKDWVYPFHFYRIVEEPDSTSGEMFLYWPARMDDEVVGETHHDAMLHRLAGRCDTFVVYDNTGSCRALFTAEPDWESILTQTQELGLLTLTDESDLPPPEPGSLFVSMGNGIGIMVVETATATEYRTYRHHVTIQNPHAPEMQQAAEIGDIFLEVDDLTPEPDAWGIHHATISNHYESKFHLCNKDKTWGQAFRLAALVERAGLTMPESGPYGYLIEFAGIPLLEWETRESRPDLNRFVYEFELLSIAPAMSPECEQHSGWKITCYDGLELQGPYSLVEGGLLIVDGPGNLAREELESIMGLPVEISNMIPRSS